MHHGIGLHSGYALWTAASIIGAVFVVAVSLFLAWRHKRQPYSRERAFDEKASGVGNQEAYTFEEQLYIPYKG